MAKRFLSEVLGAPASRPPDAGLTMVLDRLAYPLEDTLGLVGSYADIAKIGWGLPFLVEEKALAARVRTFRRHGISVSNGGTLLEICVSKGKEMAALERLAGAGFDTVELSEGVTDITWRVKKEVADFAHSRDLRLCVEVGRKNPKNQLSLEETLARVEQSLDLDPSLIIVEGRETGRSVGIYDDEGRVKWDWVARLEESSVPQRLMFEAPVETQQTELIIHIGSQVNLGNVDLRSVGALETQRRGLRGDTFGVLPGSKKVSGGPGAKFLYFVVSAHGPIDQSRLVRLTGLNRRTVQDSLKSLLDQGVITETLDPGDLRRRVYSSRG